MFYGELSWMKGGRHREKVPIEYKYDIGQEKKKREEHKKRFIWFGLGHCAVDCFSFV